MATNFTLNITIPTQSDAVPVMSVFSWIIINQRLGITFNWDLPWADYKAGFGSVDADFWLGLEKMHLLTSSQSYRLRVEVQRNSTKFWFSAEYWSFKIGDELNDKYRLEVDGYSGDAGDALMYEGDVNNNGIFGNWLHNGMVFSTYDRDHDNTPVNCAANYDGGWWYNACHYGCITCRSPGNQWRTLPGSGPGTYGTSKLVNSRMMIKRQ